MKHRIINVITAAFLSMGVITASAFAISNFEKNTTPTQAATHTENYADYSYSGSYYSSITSSLTDGMTGSLRTTLTSLINPSSVPVYSSSGATHLSSVLQEADEDPNNSSNMIYLYTRNSVTKNAANTWNREHVWPQSLSNSCWGTTRAGTDLLHLRPTYNKTNSVRGNLKYGEITSGGSAVTYEGMPYGYTSGSYFMPLDSVKGDVARIIMYVWVAYYNEYGSKLPAITNVFQSFDVLMQWHTNDKPDVMEGNRNDYAQNESMQKNRNPFVDHPEYAWKIFGSQCSSSVLAAAKAAYPADGGSTPTPTPTTVTISTTSSTLTVGGTMNLTATSSDSSNITWTTSNSSVTSINKSSTSSGGSITVTANAAGSATITAKNTSNVTATCAITVNAASGGGEVTGDTISFDLSQGVFNTDHITWTSNHVTITQMKGSGSDNVNSSFITSPRLYKGHILSFITDSGFKMASISITYNGDYKGNSMTAGTSVSENVVANNTSAVARTWDTANGGTHVVSSVSASGLSEIYIQNVASTNTQFRPTAISVTLARTLESISASGAKSSFFVGDEFAYTGLTVTATYSNGNEETVTPTSVSTPDMAIAGTKTVTVSYTESGKTVYTTYQITVEEVVVVSLTITGTATKTSYYTGDSFDCTGLTVTANYNNSTHETVTGEVYWSPNPLEKGTTQVTAMYQGVTATYSGITVVDAELSSISIDGQTTSYVVGAEFSFDGSVTAYYTNGNKRYVEPTSVDGSNVNMSQRGTYTVKVSYTEGGSTKSASYTISVTSTEFDNSVEKCYSLEKNTSVTFDVYGLYVGTSNGSVVIMNGEYGIMLYSTSANNTWIENQTYLKVAANSATLTVFKNLYELINSNVSVVTDEETIQENIAPVSTYTITGNESENDLTVANRLCLLTGTVTSITHGSSESGYSAGGDNTVMVNVNGSTFKLFVKTASATSEVGISLNESLNSSKEITVKGYSSFFNSSFEVQFKNLVEPDPTYTAEMFAAELLEATNDICASTGNRENALAGVWITFEMDKWSTLSADQKAILKSASAIENGTTIQNAMARYDIICRKYARCDNFIGRDSANFSNGHVMIGVDNNSLLIVAIATSIAMISMATIYFTIKHKKKRND